MKCEKKNIEGEKPRQKEKRGVSKKNGMEKREKRESGETEQRKGEMMKLIKESIRKKKHKERDRKLNRREKGKRK